METVNKVASNETGITVLEIKSVQNGWARVAVDNATFNKTKGRQPVLPFTNVTVGEQKKQYRKFVLDNTTLFSRIEIKEDGSIENFFVMPQADAEARLIASDETATFNF